jgi:hypothetical protein
MNAELGRVLLWNYRVVLRFDVLTAVKIQVEGFWVVTPCSAVVGYKLFGGPCCLHLQQRTWISETLLPSCNTSRRHNPEDLDLNTLLFSIKFGMLGEFNLILVHVGPA